MECLVVEREPIVAGRHEPPLGPCAGSDEASAWERFRRERAAQRDRTMPRHWRDEEGL